MFLHFLQHKEHKRAFLELAHRVANADGFVNRKEQISLRAYLDEMDLPADTFFCLDGARDIGEIVAELADDQVKHIVLLEILLLIYADGDYNENERVVIADLKQHFGLSEERFDQFKDWVIRLDQLKIEGMKLVLGSFKPRTSRPEKAGIEKEAQA